MTTRRIDTHKGMVRTHESHLKGRDKGKLTVPLQGPFI